LYYHDEKLLSELAPSAVSQSIFANMNWQVALYKIIFQYTAVPLLLMTSYHQAKWVLTSDSSGFSKYFYALWTPMQLWGVLSNPLGVHFELQKSYQTLSQSIFNLGQAINLLLIINDMAVSLPAELQINLAEVDQNNFKYFVEMTKGVGTDDAYLFQFSLAKALAAFRVYMELRKPLSKYLERFAKLDFYLSIATTMHLNPKDFSFVQFTSTNSQMLIDAKNLWNPLLDKSRAVKNNVLINAQIMLTGPNASGKSTLMKAVSMNAHLAQTIGVVTASEFTMQPLNYIHSLVTHRDKTGELSAYQMELKNMKHILQTLPEGSGLMIMDEPFRSTNPREAEIASRRVLNRLCAYQNLGLMVSTHLSALTEGESPCRRMNKHMKDYLLQEGAFTGSNALEILRSHLKFQDTSEYWPEST
jgi:ABC-type Mn2+/Zn2+ transport system ATPase subunit